MAERILAKTDDFAHSPKLQKWIDENSKQSSVDDELVNDNIIQIEDDINFIIVGDGPQFEKAQEIVEKSDILRNKVHLVGYSSEVNSFLGMFDCFILTSKVEGLPNVIIEAQFCGIPVLTTDAGGAKECFLEGETGYLSESDSVGSISEKLSSILSDKKFLNDSKSKSIEFAKEAFGEDTWAKKINKLYLGK